MPSTKARWCNFSKKISKAKNQMPHFGENAIEEAIWDCDRQKSLRPNDIHFNFLKRFWETMKKDIVRFIFEFHAHGMLPRGTNASFITLVPKVNDP